jgi:hypothetical protein
VSGTQCVPNAVVWDARLSHRALGVLVAILARQAVGAPVSADALADVGDGREGRKAVQAAMRELTAAGYLHQVRLSRGRGRIVTLTRAYAEPTTAAVARMDMQGRALREDGLLPDENRPDVTHREDGLSSDEKPVCSPYGTKPRETTRARSGADHRPVQNRPHVPTCPACLELHYPTAQCTAILPMGVDPPDPSPPAQVRRGGPTRGRGNAWSPTARRASAR